MRERNLEEQDLLRSILCYSCENGVVLRQRGRLEATVHCACLRREIPPDVVECNSYERKDGMDLHWMKEIALKIDGRKVGGQYL